uniref:Uncharacterized protein n=1 Tax=Oryza meridionalis TaxID=40149 RepID=A0A0E0DSI3_9ORYZ
MAQLQCEVVALHSCPATPPPPPLHRKWVGYELVVPPPLICAGEGRRGSWKGEGRGHRGRRIGEGSDRHGSRREERRGRRATSIWICTTEEKRRGRPTEENMASAPSMPRKLSESMASTRSTLAVVASLRPKGTPRMQGPPLCATTNAWRLPAARCRRPSGRPAARLLCPPPPGAVPARDAPPPAVVAAQGRHAARRRLRAGRPAACCPRSFSTVKRKREKRGDEKWDGGERKVDEK